MKYAEPTEPVTCSNCGQAYHGITPCPSPFGLTHFTSAHPQFNDPRFQRRITKITRPIAIVANMFDVVFDCGHSPLMFSNRELRAGQTTFCPECCEEFNAKVKPS